MEDRAELHDAVAVVGMAGRFPGAADVASFWRNVRGGVESVSFFSEEELAAEGVAPEVFRRPDYVPAKAVLDDWDRFDAGFFEFSAREAELTDPQQRLFLETSWSALEDAGYAPGRIDARVGVYAGASPSTYLLTHIARDPSAAELIGDMQTQLGNGADFLATRVAYKLGLNGPAMTVQTACSTSLVALHQACQALLVSECDMALAGGVSVQVPQRAGYVYRNGGIQSRDGHCRAFDAAAGGVVMGSGVGAVVLKRWADAVADGDFVYAVVRGSAVNNDGAVKVGFTAPSVAGQAAVITDALEVSGVDPASIGLVEAHGTGTALGDPIELAALTQAWRGFTERSGFCALGSVKSNVGHLDAAAGVTGFIKAVLSVRDGVLPPSLNFEAPNPQIDFAGSPFFVNTELRPWEGDGPRRAAVSSFGVGGTNAHVVVEQAPEAEARPRQEDCAAVTVSARSASALSAAVERLAGRLDEGGVELADAAFTLQAGRGEFAHRRAVVARTAQEAAAALRGPVPERIPGPAQRGVPAQVAFLFPWQEVRYVSVGRGLYETEPVYREHLDEVAELARPLLGHDLREFVNVAPDADLRGRSRGTDVDHPALFAMEYALARLWMSWGVTPTAMLGHSLGEYVAAHFAGVLTLEDALTLVVARGRLAQSTEPGAMMVIGAGEEQAAEIAAAAGLSLAAVNADDQCVLSGAPEAVDAVERQLAGEGIRRLRLPARRAFNSPLMDPVLDEFREVVRGVTLNPPTLPFCSNLTGTWITDELATDPEYWVRHLRETIRFGDCQAAALDDDDRIFLEAGPGTGMAWLLRRWGNDDDRAFATFPVAGTPKDEERASAVRTAARLWETGVEVDWAAVRGGAGGRRVPLPTYPFEGESYRLGGKAGTVTEAAAPGGPDADAAEPPAQAHPVTRSQAPLVRSEAPQGRVPEAGAAEGARYRRPELRVAYVEPRTELQRTVAGLWSGLLGFERVGLHDDFVDLGGDSLVSIELAAQLEELYAVPVPVELMFQHPTVEDQAEIVERLVAARQDGGAA
ncbi:type I polyketide synthase [Streptomyces sp. S186]|uniref:type I polyketide synthase n=1 Tax=Streptomyces sp. S186 TaxID=3434395 RepID=UPI003F67CC27